MKEYKYYEMTGTDYIFQLVKQYDGDMYEFKNSQGMIVGDINDFKEVQDD